MLKYLICIIFLVIFLLNFPQITVLAQKATVSAQLSTPVTTGVVIPVSVTLLPRVIAYDDADTAKFISGLDLLFNRVRAINSKISSRITKMSKSGVKVSKLTPKMTQLNNNVESLKKEMTNIKTLSKDQAKLKKEAIIYKGMLNELLVGQKNILTDMRLVDLAVSATPFTATSTVTVKNK